MSTHLSILSGRLIHFLKALGFVNPEQVKASALYRLVGRLFLFAEVRVVAVHGFAHSNDADTSQSEIEIQVITWEPPSWSLQSKVEHVLLALNRRYDTSMKVVLEYREPEVPASRAIPSRSSTTRDTSNEVQDPTHLHDPVSTARTSKS